jgi:hypothetical protein
VAKFLFVFGYESPSERRNNAEHGTDFESSNAVWVVASDMEQAMAAGRRFAEELVGRLYLSAGITSYEGWSAGQFACWIEDHPLDRFSGLALESFEEIDAGAVDLSTYRGLSLTARLAVALHCFSRICQVQNLHHSEIDAFLDDLWEFPLITSERWDEWEKNHPPLVETALGNAWPIGFEDYLETQGARPEEFRRLISSVAEIVFSSFYGAADDAFSLKCLSEVLKMAQDRAVEPPPPAGFSQSRFVDGAGWGNPITPSVRDSWRAFGC